MQNKVRLLLVVGGRSGEHEISLISGKHILQAIDRSKFQPILLVIQKNGVMTLVNEAELLSIPNNPRLVETPRGTPISLKPYSVGSQNPMLVPDGKPGIEFDMAFPILHGPGGEDGTIQGLFELSKIPVVGNDVKASAICMDKGVTKRLCESAGVPVAPYQEIYRGENTPIKFKTFPLFVKPAHLGSSLGVTKVKRKSDLESALSHAFSMDDKVLVEEGIEGREIEVAVLGNRGDLKVSPAGEVKCVKTEFYSYDAKYVDDDAVELIVPTKLTDTQLKTVQSLARTTFEALDCRGMARIDFFLSKEGKFLLNEVNTIPGFTPISQYPKLMMLTGLSYGQLITELIELAL